MSYEQAIDLGHGIFGLLTLPSSGVAGETGVILFNAGILHRPGPFRTTVRLARALADNGFSTLRFDLPGVGDSLQLADRAPDQITRDVLDCVQAHTGCKRFIVGGICSAADLGWRLALTDPRVSGVIMLDGMARKGAWFHIARIARALRIPPAALLAKVRKRFARTPISTQTVENLRDWPQPGQERIQLALLLSRGVKLFMAYTGGTSYFLHARQFSETYGQGATAAGVEFHYWAHCDHMFYSKGDRERAIVAVSAWASRSFH